jgi:transcriptional regulator with XRE-family HTH domain
MTAAAENGRRDWMTTARERTGRSQESLAHYLGVSTKTISFWERGLSVPRIDIRSDLADALGLTMDELSRRLGIEAAPEQASLNGAGSSGAFGAITEWLTMFVRAEQSAYAIWTLVITAHPALCQTAGYARAVEHSGHRNFPPDKIEHFVQKRLERAAVLDTADYLALIAAPLLDAIQGGPEVMAEQMAHLLDLADRSNITLRIIGTEHLAAAPGELTLLATAGQEADIATEIGLRGPRSDEGPIAAAEHVRLFEHLASSALDPEASRAAIARSHDRFVALATNLRKGTNS